MIVWLHDFRCGFRCLFTCMGVSFARHLPVVNRTGSELNINR